MSSNLSPVSSGELHALTRKTNFVRWLLFSGLLASGVAGLLASPFERSISRKLLSRISVTGARQASATPAFSAPVKAALVVQSGSGRMNLERRGHTATLLSDGRVLIVGGENAGGPVGPAEIFDPASGNFSFTGNLSVPRTDHTATRLSNGNVLIAGGRDGSNQALDATEIFDPNTGVFSSGPGLNIARAGASAALLSDGRIVFAGGDSTGSVEIYDPQANTFISVAGQMLAPRAQHSAAILNDGRILFAGGTAPDGGEVLSGEIFDVASGSFSPVGNEMQGPHIRPNLRVLPDGKVQIFGGSDREDMEVYDPASDFFGAHVHVFPNGDDQTNLLQEILDCPTRAALFHPGAATPLLNRTGQTITELPELTQALATGGIDSNGVFLDAASVLNSSPATVSTDKLDYAPGTVVIVSGTGWQPNELVTLTFHETPHVNTDKAHSFSVLTDGDGNFVCQDYAPEDRDNGVTYLLAAKGQSSAWTAQTSFTDASPGSLGNYATAGLTGAAASISPSNVATNVTFSTLTRGAGLAAASAADAFNSSSWSTSPALTVSGNTDYCEFTITPASCYQFSASELRVGLQRSSSGPAKAELRSSLDSFASAIGPVLNVTDTLTTFTVNLSAVSALQDRSSAVTLRIYGYNASATSGTLRIQRVISPAMVGLEVDGVVAPADANAPSITCPSTQTLNLDSNCSATVPNYTSLATTSDDCPGAITVTQSPAAGTTLNGAGSFNITLTASDANGNTANCSFTLIVTDTIAPTFLTPPVNHSALADGSCQAPVPDFTSGVVSSENCGPVTLTQNPTANTPLGPGHHPVRVTATDSAGNAGFLDVFFDVADNTPPAPNVIALPDITGECAATIATIPAATDNCAGTITATTSDALTYNTQGTFYVHWSYDDGHGNISTQTQTVIVADVTAPTIVAPADSSDSADGSCQAAVPDYILNTAAADNCGTPSLSQNPAAGTLLGLGPHTVTVTADDGHGNTSSDTVIFTVNDTTPPALECPAQINRYAYSNAGAVVTYTAPLGTDNCSGVTTTQTEGQGSGTTFPLGTTTNAFEAKDGAGLQRSCAFTVTVSQAPTSTTVASSLNPSTFLYAASFTAHVSATAGGGTPTGSVQFIIDGAPFGLPATLTGGYATSSNIGSLTIGNHTVVAEYSGDIGFLSSAGSFNQSVLKRKTTITFDGPYTAVYGTCLTYGATLRDTGDGSAAPAPISGATITLSVGTRSAAATTNSSGFGQASVLATDSPGPTTAGAVFAGDATHLGSADADPFAITPGAIGPLSSSGIYTGETVFWTTSQSSSTATLTLAVTIRDESGLCAGDIRTARVTFAVRNSDGSTTPINGATNLPVGLADPASRLVGTASAIVQYNLGNADAANLDIAVLVSGNYVLNNPVYDTIVEVARPGPGRIVGAGASNNQNSNGYLAGATLCFTNWGLDVKYNKSGTNPQGNTSIYVHSYHRPDGTIDTVLHTYRIKSNAIAALAVNVQTGEATFSGKASIQDLTNPSSPVSVDGGAVLQLKLRDVYRKTGDSPDTLAITVQKKDGGLWFSSNWIGSPPRTEEKNIATGSLSIQ
jgi:hypothetical protein